MSIPMVSNQKLDGTLKLAKPRWFHVERTREEEGILSITGRT